jgi:hypothetical protein
VKGQRSQVPFEIDSQRREERGAARLARNALKNAKITRKMPIPDPPCLVPRREFYREGPLWARIVSPVESRTTGFSGRTGLPKWIQRQIAGWNTAL